jgi:hypothetical protein
VSSGLAIVAVSKLALRMVQHRCGIAQLTGGPSERVAPRDHAINAACLGMEIRSLNIL